jgi:reductive dehalogenase
MPDKKPTFPHDPTDEEAGFEINDEFELFPQKNEMFRRSWWDPTIRNEKTEAFYQGHSEPVTTHRRAHGYQQKDYAIRNAAWHLSDVLTDAHPQDGRREGFTDVFTFMRDVSPRQADLGTPEEAARQVKKAARALGAALVGITHYDERWQYKSRYHDGGPDEELPPEIPPGLDHVIVVAVPMPYDMMKTTPSALGSAAAGVGYSLDAALLISLAQFIRDLGYRAIPSMNDTAPSIPYAIKAGLGEYGRNGLLITQEFGPRVRLGKVYTDMSLAHDHPVRFGVYEFCRICKRCAESCPARALPMGEPTFRINNISNRKGVKKWSVDAERCFAFWAAQSTDCATCIRSCPYNKDYSKWWHRLARTLAGTKLRRLVFAMDTYLGYGRRLRPDLWWEGKE